MKKVRINKYLASCGLGSRRHAEELVLKGRITINGKRINSLATTVDPDEDTVEVDRKKVIPVLQIYYIALNKPKGYITTRIDDRKRPIIMDLLPEKYFHAGVVPVGRLDRDSEGLILLTNDGELTFRLTHPSFGIKKQYIVDIDKPLEEETRLRIEKGIVLNRKKTLPVEIEFLDQANTKIKIILSEGRKRQIRETFKKFGYKVKNLKRISYGPITIRGINSGGFRPLKKGEIKLLKDSVQDIK